MQPWFFSIGRPHLGQFFVLAIIHVRFSLSAEFLPIHFRTVIQSAGRCASSWHWKQYVCPHLHRISTGLQQCQCSSVLPFSPKYRLGHPENYLFLLSKKYIFRIKLSNKIFHLILKKEALITTKVPKRILRNERCERLKLLACLFDQKLGTHQTSSMHNQNQDWDEIHVRRLQLYDIVPCSNKLRCSVFIACFMVREQWQTCKRYWHACLWLTNLPWQTPMWTRTSGISLQSSMWDEVDRSCSEWHTVPTKRMCVQVNFNIMTLNITKCFCRASGFLTPNNVRSSQDNLLSGTSASFFKIK